MGSSTPMKETALNRGCTTYDSLILSSLPILKCKSTRKRFSCVLFTAVAWTVLGRCQTCNGAEKKAQVQVTFSRRFPIRGAENVAKAGGAREIKSFFLKMGDITACLLELMEMIQQRRKTWWCIRERIRPEWGQLIKGDRSSAGVERPSQTEAWTGPHL